MGKTTVSVYRKRNSQKHPHVHGEDLDLLAVHLDLLETPPRAWGRLAVWLIVPPPFGNTPTCMGKTLGLLTVHLDLWKHPHVHGEDVYR